MQKIIKQIPNIFTLSNLFFGCCAIVFILQSGETIVRLNSVGDVVTYLPEKIWYGTLFIFLATVMDFLDGLVARLLNVSSTLGKELDSLSDLVSFGVAPSMIMYQLLRIAFVHQFEGLDKNWFLLSPAFFIACFAAYRLAKFNLDARQSVDFIGLPTPAMAIFVSALPLIIWKNYFNINTILLNVFTLYCLVLTLCYLMVSEISFESFKIKKGIASNLFLLFITFSTIVFCLFFQWLGIVITWTIYVVYNVSKNFYNKNFKE